MSNFFWSPGMTISGMAENFVADAIHFYQGSRQSAANALGITLTELDAITKRTQLNAEQQAKSDAEHKAKSAEFLARSRGIIGVDKDGYDTLSPYTSADGLDATAAAKALAATAPVPGRVTPANAIPTVSVLAEAGDPVAAARVTKLKMEEALLKKDEPVLSSAEKFPEE